MTKTHKIILPIITIIFILFFGWSTTNAQTVEKLTEQLRQVQNLPSGSVFQFVLTDEDATDAAEESLDRYMESIQDMVEQAIGIRLDFSDPYINFDDDRVVVSIRGGLGFLKIAVSASGKATWDVATQTLLVDIESVDIPVISVNPTEVNSYIQGPINDMIHKMMVGYEILSFNIYDGYAVVEAKKL